MSRLLPQRVSSAERHLGRTTTTARRVLVCACVLALSFSCLFLLGGCKDSRALKNIIHDQDSEIVDTEGGETFQIISSEGRYVAEDANLYEIGGPDVESLPVNVVYVSSDPETELPTARFVYDENSDNSSEASEGVNLTPPQDQPEQETEPDESDDRPRQNKPGTSSGTQGDKSDDDNQEQDDDGDNDDGDNDDGDNSGDEDEPQPEDPSPSGGGSDDQNAPQVYDGTGEEPELPDVGNIAAYGQVAVLVQMLGGSSAGDGHSPLAAADDELCASAFSTVFADEGAGSINPLAFAADGSGGYVPNVDQIIESHPDTVLAFSDAMFTEDEKQLLANNNISVTVVPALTSDTGIMRAAKNIAKMLDKDTEGRSTVIYEQYKAFHDSLLTEIEGDRGYGAYDGNVYDPYINPRPRTFSARKFTLVIDEWDYGATYNYGSAIKDAGAGVGISTVGFYGSPVSYYLGVAGVVNNAAAIDTTKAGAGLFAPAWQFNPTDLSPSAVSFTNSKYSSRLYTNWGTGFTKTTLSKVDTNKLSLRDASFGTATFPTVIVATDRMRDKFLVGANAAKGLYHPFGSVATEVGTIAGTLNGNKPVFTVIDENLDTSASTKAIVVNPHGLFSSWLEGSAESFLESAWAANVEAFDSDWGGSAAAEIRAFYQSFYRYDISDAELEGILGGLSE